MRTLDMSCTTRAARQRRNVLHTRDSPRFGRARTTASHRSARCPPDLWSCSHHSLNKNIQLFSTTVGNCLLLLSILRAWLPPLSPLLWDPSQPQLNLQFRNLGAHITHVLTFGPAHNQACSRNASITVVALSSGLVSSISLHHSLWALPRCPGEPRRSPLQRSRPYFILVLARLRELLILPLKVPETMYHEGTPLSR